MTVFGPPPKEKANYNDDDDNDDGRAVRMIGTYVKPEREEEEVEPKEERRSRIDNANKKETSKSYTQTNPKRRTTHKTQPTKPPHPISGGNCKKCNACSGDGVASGVLVE
ncbi:hypothetical protein EJ05DRAFT_474816 [Pseudovirgaria hyperparasitica]|uniref:Uncharacterized protein n=1 Tax=Pseudovirgaria hyperparasitica TaxID=470096 RepID=A0A6A6WCI0_9PEZI|nr:uncharacterized protein EJ05DRAFT_474816 [Pseudovirgaria hyperparasitica]KAF2759754.1 hypothetical protein EJ05DRAFT_474816 [Pseudovirgaria hyperparasitica]